MFDPHRTRRNDRRYYTRKGQVLQAKSLSAPFTIERNKVDAYKEYILKNGLFTLPPPGPIKIDHLGIAHNNGSYDIIKFADFNIHDEGDEIQLGRGLSILIIITPYPDRWNIKISYINDTSYYFEDRGWNAAIHLPSQSDSGIYFDNFDNQHYFNVFLLYNTNYDQAAASVQVYRSFYNLPLPALPE